MKMEDFENGIQMYKISLDEKEKSHNTIRKYVLALHHFIEYAEMSEMCDYVDKKCMIGYKEYLRNQYTPNTVNLYITGLNQYIKFLGIPELCIKSMNIQNNNCLNNCITNEEYKRMLTVAKTGKNKAVYYVMRTLACTGMRIKGLSYITVHAIEKGSIIVTNKGKTRSICIPNKVCQELMYYCRERNITEGYVFCGRAPDQIINESTIWRWLKKVAEEANVDKSKVFPHNFRHLFARMFMETHNDISELADILGHSRIETTRIYTRTSVEDKRKRIEALDL